MKYQSTTMSKPSNSYYHLKGLIPSKEDIEAITGVPVHNLKYYQTAFVHPTYYREPPRVPEGEEPEQFSGTLTIETSEGTEIAFRPDLDNNYERLEFMGDSVLDAVVVEYLLKRFPKEDQGFLTKIKTILVRNEMLAKYVHELGIEQYLLIHEAEKTAVSKKKESKIIGDIFESFVGALYHDYEDETESAIRVAVDESLNATGLKMNDSQRDKFLKTFYKRMFVNTPVNYTMGRGYIVCKNFILKIMERVSDDIPNLLINNTNHKDLILQYFQANRMGQPCYQIIQRPVFEMTKDEFGKDISICTQYNHTMCVCVYERAPPGIGKIAIDAPPGTTLRVGQQLEIYKDMNSGHYCYYPNQAKKRDQEESEKTGDPIPTRKWMKVKNFKQTIAGLGIHRDKKKAEQEASKVALEEYFDSTKPNKTTITVFYPNSIN